MLTQPKELGTHVKIMKCNKIPQLVGQEAEVVSMTRPDLSKYPVAVLMLEPISLETPMGTMQTKGPFPFRYEELEPTGPTALPKAFEDAAKDLFPTDPEAKA